MDRTEKTNARCACERCACNPCRCDATDAANARPKDAASGCGCATSCTCAPACRCAAGCCG